MRLRGILGIRKNFSGAGTISGCRMRGLPSSWAVWPHDTPHCSQDGPGRAVWHMSGLVPSQTRLCMAAGPLGAGSTNCSTMPKTSGIRNAPNSAVNTAPLCLASCFPSPCRITKAAELVNKPVMAGLRSSRYFVIGRDDSWLFLRRVSQGSSGIR